MKIFYRYTAVNIIRHPDLHNYGPNKCVIPIRMSEFVIFFFFFYCVDDKTCIKVDTANVFVGLLTK